MNNTMKRLNPRGEMPMRVLFRWDEANGAATKTKNQVLVTPYPTCCPTERRRGREGKRKNKQRDLQWLIVYVPRYPALGLWLGMHWRCERSSTTCRPDRIQIFIPSRLVSTLWGVARILCGGKRLAVVIHGVPSRRCEVLIFGRAAMRFILR